MDCEFKDCKYNRIWMGKGTCVLHYMARDELCPRNKK